MKEKERVQGLYMGGEMTYGTVEINGREYTLTSEKKIVATYSEGQHVYEANVQAPDGVRYQARWNIVQCGDDDTLHDFKVSSELYEEQIGE